MKMIRRVAKLDQDKIKLAPQEKVIFAAIPEVGGISRTDLIKNLTANRGEGEGQLSGKQDTARLVSYYRKHLLDSGLCVEDVVEVKKVEVATVAPAGENTQAPTGKGTKASPGKAA
jgi:hypothetical protein